MKSTHMLENLAQSSDFVKQVSNGKKDCISLMMRAEIVYEEHMLLPGLYSTYSVLFMFYTAAINLKCDQFMVLYVKLHR